jgi:hypothetical protein
MTENQAKAVQRIMRKIWIFLSQKDRQSLVDLGLAVWVDKSHTLHIRKTDLYKVLYKMWKSAGVI